MLDVRSKKLSQKIVTQAKDFGADFAGVARVDDLKHSPSHQVNGKLPEFNGVGTREVKGRKRGIVQWPVGARSAIVIGIEHPSDRPELDWLIPSAIQATQPGTSYL